MNATGMASFLWHRRRHTAITLCGIVAFPFVAFAGLLGGPAATAQTAAGTRLLAPTEVVLFTSTSLKSRDFVSPLVCALARVLTASVHAAKIDITFDRSALATPSQLDVGKVAAHFMQSTAKESSMSTFKYLLLPYDLKTEGKNYVFATSFGGPNTPHHIGVISTARLDVSDPRYEHHIGANITALRVYKLMLKSIARLAGLASPDRCVLVYPRNLPELDDKSPEFCAEDHDTLVDAGILKAQEADTGDCIAVSGREEPFRFAAVRL